MTTDSDQDFASLRNLLALQKLDMPRDTQVDEFLVEFHRRQRAQLLVSPSVFARSFGWMKERVSAWRWAPSLSYGAAFAAIAIIACAALSQQVQVTEASGQSKLSFRMPSETSFALVPGSFVPASNVSPHLSDSPTFVSGRTGSAAATRYVLATNSPGAYDATVAF
jgi:hypothetical protein